MYDLSALLGSDRFANDPEASTRIAFVHRSFRSVGMKRGLEESYFKAHFPALGLLNLAETVRQAVKAGEISPLEMRYFDEDAFAHEIEFFEAIKEWLAPAARPVVAASVYTSTVD